MSLASYRRIERLHSRYHDMTQPMKACRVCEIVWRHLERSPWISPRDTGFAV